MEVKWSLFLIILKFISGTSAAPPLVREVIEGTDVDITCQITDSPAPSSVWFRVLDRSGMEYIASVSSMRTEVKKEGPVFSSRFRASTKPHTLTLRGFSGAADTGVYSCASLGKDIKFGPVTRLTAVSAAKPAPPSTKIPTAETPPPSPAPCVCPTEPAAVAQMQCSVLILAPLAGGCGLLLLLLLCTVLYCNSVRTRRCPHHYKRKPRMVAPGKLLMTNAHG